METFLSIDLLIVQYENTVIVDYCTRSSQHSVFKIVQCKSLEAPVIRRNPCRGCSRRSLKNAGRPLSKNDWLSLRAFRRRYSDSAYLIVRLTNRIIRSAAVLQCLSVFTLNTQQCYIDMGVCCFLLLLRTRTCRIGVSSTTLCSNNERTRNLLRK